jgi:hypothetical protein
MLFSVPQCFHEFFSFLNFFKCFPAVRMIPLCSALSSSVPSIIECSPVFIKVPTPVFPSVYHSLSVFPSAYQSLSDFPHFYLAFNVLHCFPVDSGISQCSPLFLLVQVSPMCVMHCSPVFTVAHHFSPLLTTVQPVFTIVYHFSPLFTTVQPVFTTVYHFSLVFKSNQIKSNHIYICPADRQFMVDIIVKQHTI